MKYANRLALTFLMILSITILWIAGPFADLLNKSAGGPLSTPFPGSGGGSALWPESASSSQNPAVSQAGEPSASPGEAIDERDAYRYEKVVLNTADGPQTVHYLEINLKDPRVVVKPVSSHETLFGYEYLSAMAGKTKARAAVNAGFSYPDGLPGGMFYSNKILRTPASGRFPVLFLMDGRAVISDCTQSVNLKSGETVLGSVFFNYYSKADGIYAFTPIYGSSDRIAGPHLSVAVKGGKAAGVYQSEKATDIPGDGFLIDAVGPDAEKKLQGFALPGKPIELAAILNTSEPLNGEYLSAYECGSRLIKDGKDVCPEYDPWAGGLMTREPRTAVGIKSDGTLLFAVVDGRGDSSIGATGPELVQMLLEKDVRQAALLDGGASSEMIVDGAIVNNPSAGRERLLFACFALFVN